MSDQTTEPAADRIPERFRLAVDARDVIGGAGLVLAFGGLATVHWGLAVAVAGGGLFALALRLAR